MKKQYLFIFLIVILLLSACAKESTAVPETQNQMPFPSSAPQNEDTSEGKPVDFRFLYRGFSAVSLDDFSAMSNFMEFGTKIIDNDKSWQAFMESYCPGIPYDEEWDFSKEYMIASIMLGAKPTYAVCNKLTGLSLADGHFIFEYENDPAEYIYALNGDDTAHFYVEVIIVGRENMPDDAGDMLYLPTGMRRGVDELSDITGNTWQETYRKVIQSDRNNLLADPDHIRSQVEGTQVYIGVHDFDGDGTPELIFGDGVSLAVFTYSNGCIKKIQDICFPGTVWCVNGVCFQRNALRAECNGSGGSAYVNFGYLDGQYLMGRYTEQCPDIPCTVNETVCSLEEFTRIYPLDETEYSDYLSEVLKEKLNLIQNGIDWVIQLRSGEEIMVNNTFDFSQFAW